MKIKHKDFIHIIRLMQIICMYGNTNTYDFYEDKYMNCAIFLHFSSIMQLCSCAKYVAHMHVA
jgi:hypothetical protein